ncbi:hypothetical protein JW935_11685 [candidate division KSB1 bacterium]|nr:hypothetical protein [candidate division KSB1 bacterium]
MTVQVIPQLWVEGAYAALVLPVLTRFTPHQMAVTMLEVIQPSLDAARLLST